MLVYRQIDEKRNVLSTPNEAIPPVLAEIIHQENEKAKRKREEKERDRESTTYKVHYGALPEKELKVHESTLVKELVAKCAGM